MFSATQIIRNNNSTFYDFNSNKRRCIRSRLMVFVATSLVLALAASTELKDLLDGVIPVQAILTGFSFSVMFFLSSGQSTSDIVPGDSIENGLRRSRLAILSKELFYNLSYFNLTAMCCLILALILLLPDSEPVVAKWAMAAGGKRATDIVYMYSIIQDWLGVIVRFLFYFLLIESTYTFVRTISRVNYLFEQKISSPASND